MTAMAEPVDEFAFLREEADAVGVAGPLPTVSRVDHRLGRGALSGLSWGDAPARVVLVHGAALNAHTWDATLLAWGVPALALDLPGHGESAWRTDGNYTPTACAPVLAEALDDWTERGLVVRRPVLVGQSLGGLTAAVLAATHPEQVRRVVLVDILPLPVNTARELAAFLAGPAQFDSRAQIVERALAFGLGGGRRRVERAVHLNTRERDDGSVVWKHHVATLDPATLLREDAEELWSLIGGLAVPVDLVWASTGLLTEAAVAELARRRPGSRTVRIESGHNIQEDAPAELAHVLAGLIGDDVS
jgi:pimeloyl-ACP methyl ester carboxylesterase